METALLTQGADGVLALSGVQHLAKHVRNADSVSEHVSADHDADLGRSGPEHVD